MKPWLGFILILSLWAPVSYAGQMSTYVKGTIIKRARTYIVVQNKQGTYWISTKRRPPSHSKKYTELETGFWVQLKDIKRFRPNTNQARESQSKPLS